MKKLFLAALLLPFCSCVIVKFPDTVQIDVAAKDLEKSPWKFIFKKRPKTTP
ncbi:MAG: hypothetical protein O3A07_07090 [Bacteroidetes bacterium]|nr:hypothetical protein [Bacteroidota bacterium]